MHPQIDLYLPKHEEIKVMNYDQTYQLLLDASKELFGVEQEKINIDTRKTLEYKLVFHLGIALGQKIASCPEDIILNKRVEDLMYLSINYSEFPNIFNKLSAYGALINEYDPLTTTFNEKKSTVTITGGYNLIKHHNPFKRLDEIADMIEHSIVPYNIEEFCSKAEDYAKGIINTIRTEPNNVEKLGLFQESILLFTNCLNKLSYDLNKNKDNKQISSKIIPSITFPYAAICILRGFVQDRYGVEAYK